MNNICPSDLKQNTIRRIVESGHTLKVNYNNNSMSINRSSVCNLDKETNCILSYVNGEWCVIANDFSVNKVTSIMVI